MRITVRLSSLLLALCLLLGFAGCDALSFLDPPPASNNSGDENFIPATITEVVKTAFERTYADQLSPNEKYIYDTVAALTPGTESVSLTLPEVPELCRGRAPSDAEQEALQERLSAWAANALFALWLDTPDLLWVDHTRYSYELSLASGDDGIVRLTSLTLKLTAMGTKEEIAAKEAALKVATADFRPTGSTVRQKVEYINSYLCARITYDKNAPNRASAYGALVEGRCVCEGYARAFTYLCKKAGIDAVNIPGYATSDGETEGHMWNGVFIDGKLYAVDVTWNDTTRDTKAYILIGQNTVVHDNRFGDSHNPDMLTLSGSHKAFALPTVADEAYVEQPVL